jgi:murein DD-endopeptidase MepM/ murein hydrolase activator NlpD
VICRALALLTLAACTSAETVCERTGQCLSVGDGGQVIAGTPALAEAELFAPPVAAALDISSTFGPRWKRSANRTDFHLGIDYFGAPGTPLLAIGRGKVVGVYPVGSRAFPNGGNVLVIEHMIPPRQFHDHPVDRIYAVYLHTRAILVAENDLVTAGQRVAEMGMTGDTDFVHLHFEIRVAFVCSLEYQAAHRGTMCGDGYDPHVHPFLFVGGLDRDQITVEEMAAGAGEYAVRYTATRGDLDLDVIATDLGTIGFNAREGLNATSISKLDHFDYGFLRIVPSEFLSGSETLSLELHFAKRPAYLELRDIYGWGLRYGALPPSP